MKRRNFLGTMALAPVGAVLDPSAVDVLAGNGQVQQAKKNIAGPVSGLPGEVVHQNGNAPGAAGKIEPLAKTPPSKDIDLVSMATAAMNYLIKSPRKELNFEPVFQVKPLLCPPAPTGHDPIVPGDTDCRMDWEFIYMREISGSQEGLEVEKGLRNRVLGYVRQDGLAWVPPGHYMEGDVYKGAVPKGSVASTWATAKIIRSLSETYERTRDRDALALARKMFLALRQLATWDSGRAYYEGGSGAWKDGKWVKRQQPTAAVEQLVRYWEVSRDAEALDFAIALSEGLIASPELLKDQRGAVIKPTGEFSGHMHSTLHGVWGVAHLGAVLKESRYTEWAKRAYDYANSHSMGTGWISAALGDLPVRQLSETCATSDMVSLAAWIARGGYPEYWDHVERYVRNYLVQTQFFITPEYQALYRRVNSNKSKQEIEAGLERMKDFEGGFIGNPAPNSWINWMVTDEYINRYNGQRINIFGCCVPEGMRALYTGWSSVMISAEDDVLVNTSFNKNSAEAQVVSFLPQEGRLTAVAKKSANFFLRPPSWANRENVLAYVNGQKTDVSWGGPGMAYVKFPRTRTGDELTITYPVLEFTQKVDLSYAGRPDLVFQIKWRGNNVTEINPRGEQLAMHTVK